MQNKNTPNLRRGVATSDFTYFENITLLFFFINFSKYFSLNNINPHTIQSITISQKFNKFSQIIHMTTSQNNISQITKTNK